MTTQLTAAQVAPYTEAQRTFARSLMHAYGSIPAARKHLQQLWQGHEALPDAPGRVPAEQVMRQWRDDSRIKLDDDLIVQFRDATRAFVIGSAYRIAEQAEQCVANALRDEDPGAAVKYMSVWSAATDKLAPRESSNSPFGALTRGMGPGTKFVATVAFEQPPLSVGAPPREARIVEAAQ